MADANPAELLYTGPGKLEKIGEFDC